MCKPYINTINRRFSSSSLLQKECVGVSNLFPSSFFFGDSLVKAINLTATVILHLTCRRKENGKKKTELQILLLAPILTAWISRNYPRRRKIYERTSARSLFSLHAVFLWLFTDEFMIESRKEKNGKAWKEKLQTFLSLGFFPESGAAKRGYRNIFSMFGSSQSFHF